MPRANLISFCPPEWRRLVSRAPLQIVSGARKKPHLVDDALGRFLRCDWGQVGRSQALLNNQLVKKKDPQTLIFGQYPATHPGNPLIVLHRYGQSTLIGLDAEMGDFTRHF